jgi:hypothetical protein
MSIKEANPWIPVADRMPDEEFRYYETTVATSLGSNACILWWDAGRWLTRGGNLAAMYTVTAWRPIILGPAYAKKPSERKVLS